MYGKNKYDLEKWFLKIPHSKVIRPGLVVGNGGIYQRISGFVQRFKYLPLPGGGKG